MLTVIVITDEPLIGAGLKSLLADRTEFQFLGCAKNPAELASISPELSPDVLFFAMSSDHDFSLADMRAAAPRSAVVILRREFSPEYAHQALEAGIRGLITSRADAEALKDCLRRAARGELWMENHLSMMLLDTRPIKLSKRQSELISLLAQGLKNKEIATVLGISEGTVKAYLTALFEKVGAKDRFDLALFGLKHLHDFNVERVGDRSLAVPARSYVPRRLEKVTVA